MISIKKLKAAVFAIAMLYVAIGVELYAAQRPRPARTRGGASPRRSTSPRRAPIQPVAAIPVKPAALSGDALKKAVLADIILLSSEDYLLEGVQIGELKSWVENFIKKANDASLNAFNTANQEQKKEQVGLVVGAFKVEHAYKQFEPFAEQKTFDTQKMQQFVDLYTQLISLVQDQKAQFDAVSNKGSFGAQALQAVLADCINKLNLQTTRVTEARAKLAQLSREKVQEPEAPELVEVEPEEPITKRPVEQPEKDVFVRPTLPEESAGKEESAEKVEAPLLVKEEVKEPVIPQNHAVALKNIEQVIVLLSKKSITQNDVKKINTFIAPALYTFADNNEVYLGLEALQAFAGIKTSPDQYNLSRKKRDVEGKIAQAWGVAKDDTKQPEYIRSLAQRIVAAFVPAGQQAAEKTVVPQYQSGEAPVVQQWDTVALRQQKAQLSSVGKKALAETLERLISWMYTINDTPDRFVSSSLLQLPREHKALVLNVQKSLDSEHLGMLDDWRKNIIQMINFINNAINQTKLYDQKRRDKNSQLEYITLDELYDAQVRAFDAVAVVESATKRNDKQKPVADVLLAHALQYKDLIGAWMHDLQANMQQENENFVPMIPYELIQAVALEDGGRNKSRQDEIKECWLQLGKAINATAGNYATRSDSWDKVRMHLNYVYFQAGQREDSARVVMSVLRDAAIFLQDEASLGIELSKPISYKILSLAGWSYIAEHVQDLSARSRAELLALVCKNMMQLLDKNISEQINNDEIWPMSDEGFGASSGSGFVSGFKGAILGSMFGAKKSRYTALSQSGDLTEGLNLSDDDQSAVAQLQELLEHMPLGSQEFVRYTHESAQKGFKYYEEPTVARESTPRRSAPSRQQGVIAGYVEAWMLTVKNDFVDGRLHFSRFVNLMSAIEKTALDKTLRGNSLDLRIVAQRVVRKMAEVYIQLFVQDRVDFPQVPTTPRLGSLPVGAGSEAGWGQPQWQSQWQQQAVPQQQMQQQPHQQGQPHQLQPQQQYMQPQPQQQAVPQQQLQQGGGAAPVLQQLGMDLSRLKMQQLEQLHRQKNSEREAIDLQIGQEHQAGKDTSALYVQAKQLERDIAEIKAQIDALIGQEAQEVEGGFFARLRQEPQQQPQAQAQQEVVMDEKSRLIEGLNKLSQKSLEKLYDELFKSETGAIQQREQQQKKMEPAPYLQWLKEQIASAGVKPGIWAVLKGKFGTMRYGVRSVWAYLNDLVLKLRSEEQALEFGTEGQGRPAAALVELSVMPRSVSGSESE